MPHRYIIADVFTERAFGGNQLAVFPDGRGLSDRAMQAVAREFNFSETTFVLPPDDPANAFRVRIFTPTAELPFAGHPTVGTAAVLARLGMIDVPGGKGSVVFEEGVGPVHVDLEISPDRAFARLSLEKAVDHPAERPTREVVAAALSLSADDVRETWYASVGVPFCFAQLADREAVDRAAPDPAGFAAGFSSSAFASILYFFAGDTAPGGALYARMFAPEIGIVEDPATGSACATLAGSLAERTPERDGVFSWQIDQGVAMGRPSRIESSAEKREGRTVRVMAGGCTVLVAEGEMTVPAGL